MKISITKIIVIFLYLLAYVSAPSIFKAASWYFPEILAIFFVLFTALYSKIKLDIVSFYAISLIVISVPSLYLVYQLSDVGISSTLSGLIAIYMLLIANTYINDQHFRDMLMIPWVYIYSVVPIFTIFTFVLSYIGPELFVKVNFNDYFPGNNRVYSAFFSGLHISETFELFKLNRMVGIMTEPAKMSLIFAINAYLGLFGKSKFFSKKFGYLNLFAGLTTLSTTYLIAFIAIIIFKIIKKPILLSLFSLVIIMIFLQIIQNPDPGGASYNSYGNRVRRILDFYNILIDVKLGALIGVIWFYDRFFQYPSSLIYQIYNIGFIGLFIYLALLWKFLKPSLLLIAIILIYSLSLAWQSYLIGSLALIIIAADRYSTFENNQTGQIESA